LRMRDNSSLVTTSMMVVFVFLVGSSLLTFMQSTSSTPSSQVRLANAIGLRPNPNHSRSVQDVSHPGRIIRFGSMESSRNQKNGNDLDGGDNDEQKAPKARTLGIGYGYEPDDGGYGYEPDDGGYEDTSYGAGYGSGSDAGPETGDDGRTDMTAKPAQAYPTVMTGTPPAPSTVSVPSSMPSLSPSVSTWPPRWIFPTPEPTMNMGATGASPSSATEGEPGRVPPTVFRPVGTPTIVNDGSSDQPQIGGMNSPSQQFLSPQTTNPTIEGEIDVESPQWISSPASNNIVDASAGPVPSPVMLPTLIEVSQSPPHSDSPGSSSMSPISSPSSPSNETNPGFPQGESSPPVSVPGVDTVEPGSNTDGMNPGDFTQGDSTATTSPPAQGGATDGVAVPSLAPAMQGPSAAQVPTPKDPVGTPTTVVTPTMPGPPTAQAPPPNVPVETPTTVATPTMQGPPDAQTPPNIPVETPTIQGPSASQAPPTTNSTSNTPAGAPGMVTSPTNPSTVAPALADSFTAGTSLHNTWRIILSRFQAHLHVQNFVLP
jgi:hypothetical protein